VEFEKPCSYKYSACFVLISFLFIVDLLTVPPGFEKGAEFPPCSLGKLTSATPSVISLGDLLSSTDEIPLVGEEEHTDDNLKMETESNAVCNKMGCAFLFLLFHFSF
jgi:hypothetical protein